MKKIAIKDILVVFLFFMAFPLEAQVIRDDWSYYFRMTDLPNRPAGFIYKYLRKINEQMPAIYCGNL